MKGMKVVIGIVGVVAAISICVDNVLAQQEQTTKAENRFVGAEKCKTCHPDPYHDWKSRQYSKSWKVIKMRGKANDPECLKCHTVGYGEEGGFDSVNTTPELVGKQCESCHGAGERHVMEPSNSVVKKGMKEYVHGKNVCVKCHSRMRTHRTIEF